MQCTVTVNSQHILFKSEQSQYLISEVLQSLNFKSDAEEEFSAEEKIYFNFNIKIILNTIISDSDLFFTAGNTALLSLFLQFFLMLTLFEMNLKDFIFL